MSKRDLPIWKLATNAPQINFADGSMLDHPKFRASWYYQLSLKARSSAHYVCFSINAESASAAEQSAAGRPETAFKGDTDEPQGVQDVSPLSAELNAPGEGIQCRQEGSL